MKWIGDVMWWCCLAAVVLYGLALANVVSASETYEYLGDGIWRGSNGGYYLRSEDREPYQVKVRYCYNGCYSYRYETRYRNAVKWTPIKMAKRDYESYAKQGWKELFIAKQAEALENQDFLAAFRMMTKQAADRPAEAIYGQSGQVAYQSQQGYYPNAITAQSVYGYPPTAAQYGGAGYGAPGLNALLEAAAAGRAVQQAGETYREFGKVTMDLMAKALEGQREMSRYERDIAIASLLTDIATQPESHVQTVTPQSQSHTVRVEPVAPVAQQPTANQDSAKQVLLAAQGIVSSRCASCHNADKAPKGWDLSNWAALALDEKQKVLQVVQSGTMPLDAESGETVPLSKEEVDTLRDATLLAAMAATERG